MELTILGTSASFPTPKRACSSYLVGEEDDSVLLDIGPGSLANLMVFARPEALSAIILTHLHQDHFLDIFPLYYYLKYEAKLQKRLRVFAPRGASVLLGSLLGRDGEERLSEVLEFVELDSGTMTIGGLALAFEKMRHLDSTYGVAATVDGCKLAYSSDTAYTESLIRLAEGASFFICEATLAFPNKEVEHLTAEEAGDLAAAASVGVLMLTHIWPSLDHERSRLIAEEHFIGEVMLAEDGERMLI